MVDREKFKVLVKGMKAVYVQPAFIPDQDAFNVWYGLLKDLSYEELSKAIQKHMMTSPYPPTISDIREAVAQLAPDDGIMSELKAWNLVRRAIRNSNYHAEEEFGRLPCTIRAAVGNPANLREWAMMPIETVESVEQSHFIRAYRAAVERDKEMAKLTPEVKEAYTIGNDAGPGRIGGAAVPPTVMLSMEGGIPMPARLKKRMQELIGV